MLFISYGNYYLKGDAILPEDPFQTILNRVRWQCTLNIEIYAFCFQFALCIYLRYPYILYPFQHPFHHFAIPSSCIPKDIGGKWAECETGSLFHCMVLVRAFTSYPSSDFGMYSYQIKLKTLKISLIIFLFFVQNGGLWILL